MWCHKTAPSNPNLPPKQPEIPRFPFQRIAADYFTFKGQGYLIIVDRFSNWPVVKHCATGATGLINALKDVINTFGVPEELSTDGGSEFTSSVTQKVMDVMGIKHRISSVANPRSNGRAEVAVKTMKRLLMNNTSTNGQLYTDGFLKAIMTYRNTPCTATGISPAVYIFNIPIRDFLPDINVGKPHTDWYKIQKTQEDHFRNPQDRLYEHTRSLKPLKVKDKVFVQNQIGNHQNKWDNTGEVDEVKQNDQYVIKMDHSGRFSIRNRKYLRKWEKPMQRTTPNDIITSGHQLNHPSDPTRTSSEPEPDHSIPPEMKPSETPQDTPTELSTNQELRRSSRTKKPPERLSYNELGQPVT